MLKMSRTLKKLITLYTRRSQYVHNPACKNTTLSQEIDAKKRTGFGAGRGQGEGRLKFLDFENLDVID